MASSLPHLFVSRRKKAEVAREDEGWQQAKKR